MNVHGLSGRELDALVAQQLFGLQVQERANLKTGEQDFVYNARPQAPTPEWVRVPFYAAGFGASITVEVELQKRGWRRKEASEPGVVLEHADGRTVEAVGPLNEALCRAALKAVAP